MVKRRNLEEMKVQAWMARVLELVEGADDGPRGSQGACMAGEGSGGLT